MCRNLRVDLAQLALRNINHHVRRGGRPSGTVEYELLGQACRNLIPMDSILHGQLGRIHSVNGAVPQSGHAALFFELHLHRGGGSTAASQVTPYSLAILNNGSVLLQPPGSVTTNMY